jgi:serine/threonine protein kinase
MPTRVLKSRNNKEYLPQVRNYKDNVVLGNIIKKVVPEKRGVRFFRNTRIKETYLRKKESVRSWDYIVQPYLSNCSYYCLEYSINKSNGYDISIIPNNENRDINIIGNLQVYLVEYNKDMFKSLIFHYLLQKYYENNYNKNSLKYLINLYEFGTICFDEPSSNDVIPFDKPSYYAIMEKSKNLFDYFKELLRENNTSIQDRLIKLIGIFKECCNAVKIIHNLEYLYLNINLESFRLSKYYDIKINDFKFSKKNGYKTNEVFGKLIYIPNDWYKNSLSKKETTLQYHHDIFSLGCMFIQLLYNYVFKENIFMVCPIESNNNFDVSSQKKEYTIKLHNNDMEKLRNKLINKLVLNKDNKSVKENLSNNIVELINNMVNPDPEKRYTNISDVISQIDKIKNSSE